MKFIECKQNSYHATALQKLTASKRKPVNISPKYQVIVIKIFRALFNLRLAKRFKKLYNTIAK